MSILVVDDESNTREAIRNLLTHEGYGPVIEARNGEEALKVLTGSTAARVQMIIADWEMPYMDGITLLKQVATLPELDRAPFLLITSDLPTQKLEALRVETPRLDAHLLKPFRIKSLTEAMALASRRRAESHNVIIVYGKQWGGAIKKCLSMSERILWKNIVEVSSTVELDRAVQSHLRNLGLLLIEQAQASTLGAEWLASFNKSRLGSSVPVVSLGKDPGQIHVVRTDCQMFVAPEARDTYWIELLEGLSNQACVSWNFEKLTKAAKELFRAKDFKGAKSKILEALKLDDLSAEAHTLAADIFDELDDAKLAQSHYLKATTINPCSPRSWMRLFDVLSKDQKAQPQLLSAADCASQYCPASPDVLLAAARVWRNTGDEQKAQAAAQVVLRAQPNHAGAKEFLAAVSGETAK